MARFQERSTYGAAVRHARGSVLARAGLAAVVLIGLAAAGFATGAHFAADMPVPAGPGCAKRFYDRAPGLPPLDSCLAAPRAADD